jgi:hypothetical protein
MSLGRHGKCLVEGLGGDRGDVLETVSGKQDLLQRDLGQIGIGAEYAANLSDWAY